jgi:hypothetical protein
MPIFTEEISKMRYSIPFWLVQWGSLHLEHPEAWSLELVMDCQRRWARVSIFSLSETNRLFPNEKMAPLALVRMIQSKTSPTYRTCCKGLYLVNYCVASMAMSAMENQVNGEVRTNGHHSESSAYQIPDITYRNLVCATTLHHVNKYS